MPSSTTNLVPAPMLSIARSAGPANASVPPDYGAIKTRQQATWASGDFGRIGVRLQIVGRIAVRSGRPARRREGHRRRGRQRQRVARGGAPLRRGDLDRLRGGVARAGAAPRRRRRAVDGGAARRRREPAVRGRRVRRRAVDVRRDVRAQPGARRRRDAARGQARRSHRPRRAGRPTDSWASCCASSVASSRRPPVWRRRPRGAPRPASSSCSGPTRATSDTQRKPYVFRYLSAAHWIQIFRSFYGPVNRAFAALDDAGQAALHQALLRAARVVRRRRWPRRSSCPATIWRWSSRSACLDASIQHVNQHRQRRLFHDQSAGNEARGTDQ